MRSKHRYIGLIAGGGITFALLTPFAPAAQAACTPPTGGACGDTGVTFTVNGGALAISVPANASLGSAAPGNTSSPASLGQVQVVDTRGSDLVWHCSVVATNLTSSGKLDIPATGGAYDPGTITTNNPTVNGVTPHTSSNLSQPTEIATHASGTGNSTTTWTPTITWIVPITAQAGSYTGTVTHSVSPT